VYSHTISNVSLETYQNITTDYATILLVGDINFKILDSSNDHQHTQDAVLHQ